MSAQPVPRPDPTIAPREFTPEERALINQLIPIVVGHQERWLLMLDELADELAEADLRADWQHLAAEVLARDLWADEDDYDTDDA